MASTAGLAPIITPGNPDLSANQTPRIIAAGVSLIVLPTVMVTLRFLARFLSKAGLWWDDWCVLAAMMVSWGPNVLIVYSTTHGFGQHIAAEGNLFNRIDEAEWWFKMLYVYEILYVVAAGLAKYSILLFYSRIFKEKRFVFWLRITFALTTAWFISSLVVVLAECVPIQALWDPSVTGQCINLFAFFQGAGVPNVLLNSMILLLPLPMIWTLEIDLKHKIALSGVFLLGSFVVVVSIIRLVIFSRLEIIDVTWEFVDASIWNAAEPSIAVCSASMPILRSLWVWNRRIRSGRPGGAATPDSYQDPKDSVVNRQRGGVSKGRVPGVKKGGSFSSQQYPLNELPAGVQQVFGNRVVVTGNQSRKVSDDEEMWADLPIMHPQETAHYGRENYTQAPITPVTPSDRSELYG